MEPGDSWEGVGLRVAEARKASGFSQAELAARTGIERTALAKAERGRRSIAALELVRIAAAVDRPLEWFVREPPPSVVSRRAAISGSVESRLDVEIDRASRDVALVIELGALPHRPTQRSRSIRSYEQAEQLAQSARTDLGVAEGPVLGLATLVERVGLYTFGVTIDSPADDGGYVAIDGTGVAVVNASNRPGRRRFTLAHELGHHLLADAYAADADLLAEEVGRERLINAFAAHLLLPRAAVTSRWRQLDGSDDPRGAAIVIAVEYRVSWSALCGLLRTIGLLTHQQREALTGQPPTRSEQVELGLEITEELPSGYVSPAFAAAVVRAYRQRLLGRSRALELLRGTLTEDELPEPFDASQAPELERWMEP